MRTTRSDLESELRVEPGIHNRSEALGRLWRYGLQGGQVLAPMAPERRYGARRSPLSEYMSLRLSHKLTTNCVPLSRIKWEIYLYKEMCFVSLIDVRSLSLIKFLVGNDATIQHLVRRLKESEDEPRPSKIQHLKIGLIIEKSPDHLRRLAVTQWKTTS